jgi:predicted Zn-dependent peptidase
VVLGSSMSSRLFQEVRENRGLAYSIYSFINSHEDTGLFGIYAGIAEEHVLETLDIIRGQLSILLKECIPEAELKAAKEYLKGNMYLNAESTDSRMNRLAKNEFLFGRYVPYEEVEESIDRVTSDAVQKWFEDLYQPSQAALILFGPVEQGTGEHATAVLNG